MLPSGQSEDDRVGIIPVNITNVIPNESVSSAKHISGPYETRAVEICIIDNHSRDIHPEGIAAAV